MKTMIVIFIVLLNSIYGFAGIGITPGTNSIGHPNGISPLLVGSNEVGSFSYDGFDNATSIGGYLYIDALPMVDLDLEFNVKVAPYYFSFENAVSSQDSMQFVWASTTLYMTITKNLLKTSVPFLAKMRMFAGGGLNTHNSTPMVNQAMLEAMMDGDIENGTFNENKMIEYLNENKIETGGFHIQLGAQFKLLVFDSMLIYRRVFTDGITPNTNGFNNFNLRLGYGL